LLRCLKNLLARGENIWINRDYNVHKFKQLIVILLILSHAFNRIWHDSLLFKLKSFILPAYYLLVKSYLLNRHLQIRSGSAFSDKAAINDGLPQRSILPLTIYNIYTSDQPNTQFTSVTDYTNESMLKPINVNSFTVSSKLQNHIHSMEGLIILYWL
jgi:hypothetical protein